MWVPLDMSTKRRGLYITYTPTRAADGSDGERAAWPPFSVGCEGLSYANQMRWLPAREERNERWHLGEQWPAEKSLVLRTGIGGTWDWPGQLCGELSLR